MDIRAFLKLIRIRMCVYTAVIPVTGALAVGPTEPWRLVVLFIIGACYHASGMISNDYFDLRYDRFSTFNSRRVLPSGALSPRTALRAVLISCGLYIALPLVLWPNLRPFLMAAGAAVFGELYNVAGKRFVGSEACLAVSVVFCCLLGTVSAAPALSPMAWATALLWGLEWLYLNVLTGLKDLEHDRAAGARSLPLALGVTETGATLVFPARFKLALSAVRCVQCVIVIFAVASGAVGRGPSTGLLWAVLVTAAAGILAFDYTYWILPATVPRPRHFRLFCMDSLTGCVFIMLLLVPRSGYLPLVLTAALGAVSVVAGNVLLFRKPRVGYPWETGLFGEAAAGKPTEV